MTKIFQFKRKQEIFDIGGVKIGGQPGELPTVLIGSMFYDKDKNVLDPIKGIFKKKEVESLIKKQEEMSDKTGNPFFIDIVGHSTEALIRYINFISNLTTNPFLIDAATSTVRLSALKHCIEVGLKDRAIYNSIDESVSDQELKTIKKLEVEAVVVLAFNSLNPKPEGRMELLKGSKKKVGLLETAYQSGTKKILVDVAVLDAPSIGISARTIYMVKTEYGLPSGCAPSNAMTTWKSLKKLGDYTRNICIACSHAILPIVGADFLIYGPIKYAEIVFPTCAMVDAFLGYDMRWRGEKLGLNHPLYRIF